ncbi:uncharacterized protein PHA67_006606 [Liasis olivaceus]
MCANRRLPESDASDGYFAETVVPIFPAADALDQLTIPSGRLYCGNVTPPPPPHIQKPPFAFSPAGEWRPPQRNSALRFQQRGTGPGRKELFSPGPAIEGTAASPRPYPPPAWRSGSSSPARRPAGRQERLRLQVFLPSFPASRSRSPRKPRQAGEGGRRSAPCGAGGVERERRTGTGFGHGSSADARQPGLERRAAAHPRAARADRGKGTAGFPSEKAATLQSELCSAAGPRLASRPTRSPRSAQTASLPPPCRQPESGLLQGRGRSYRAGCYRTNQIP